MTKIKKQPFFKNAFNDILNERETWDHASFSELFQKIKKELVERILEKELESQLGYEKHQPSPSSNRRNGTSDKTILTGPGPLSIEIPRDRDGQFTPVLIPKHQRRFPEMDQKILTMYMLGVYPYAIFNPL